MQAKQIPAFDSTLAALEAGIAESDRRDGGDFDGFVVDASPASGAVCLAVGERNVVVTHTKPVHLAVRRC